MRRDVLIGGIAFLLLVVSATGAKAQGTDIDQIQALQNIQLLSFQPITAQFNFASPGARSLGMGGAFVALADDATAAFANPAGLLQLSRQEVSVEFRNFGFESEFIDGGHAFGQPSCIGFDQPVGGGGCPDRGEAVNIETTDDDVSSLSFFSYVRPINDRFAVALYRHELANFEAGFQSAGFFVNVPLLNGIPGLPMELGNGSTPLRVFPSQTNVDLEIENVGISAAFRANEDFSIGLGVSFYDFAFDLQARNFGVEHFGTLTDLDDLADHPFFQDIRPETFAMDNLATRAFQRGDDDDIGFTGGFLWNFTERWTVGGVYRQGPSFEFLDELVGADGVAARGARRGEFSVPDVASVGLAFRPSSTAKISFEYSRVEYSALTEQQGVPPFGLSSNLTTDDADEAHIGFEYIFVNTKFPIAVRAGAWNDPDHRIRFDEPLAQANIQPISEVDTQAEYEQFISDVAATRIDRTLFQAGPNDFHFSAGFGIVFNDRFQLDAAADFAELVDTFSFSGVIRF